MRQMVSGNLNTIVTDGWSDLASRALYEAQWPLVAHGCNESHTIGDIVKYADGMV